MLGTLDRDDPKHAHKVYTISENCLTAAMDELKNIYAKVGACNAKYRGCAFKFVLEGVP